MKKQLLVLMYHYIRGEKASYLDGMYGPTQQMFKEQLSLAAQQYTPVSMSEVADEILAGEDVLPEKSFLITFDDGTADNYLNAYPVLQDLGMKASFFLISDCISRRTLTAVHARHLLRAKLGGDTFKRSFVKTYEQEFGPIAEVLKAIPKALYRNAYRWDTEETAQFKYATNFALPPKQRNTILEQLFNNYIGNWKAWGDKFYLSIPQINEMIEAGHSFGGHSHRHEALGMLPSEDLAVDLQACRQYLDETISAPTLSFSYPFGKKEHYSKNVIAQLEQNSFSLGFLNIQGINSLADIQEKSKFEILRIDPKDLPTYL